MEGWQLDKDILIKGNKIYSPDTCCFVPSEINNLFVGCNKSRGSLPIGVTFNKRLKRYVAQISKNKKYWLNKQFINEELNLKISQADILLIPNENNLVYKFYAIDKQNLHLLNSLLCNQHQHYFHL